MGDYKISDIYQGGYSSLNPEYSSLFTGYRVKDTSTIGVSSDPRTANILKDVSDKLSTGQKVIELSMIDLGTPLDTISKQQLEEVNRLSKLTGVDITVHGPIVDASGITQQGVFDDAQREIIERKLINSIERSQQLNKDGNISVTFHTANSLPGAMWSKTKKGEKILAMPVLNQETGQLSMAREEEKYYPHPVPVKGERSGEVVPVGKPVIYTPGETIKIMNDTKWSNDLDQVEFNRQHANKLLEEIHPIFIGRYLQWKEHEYNPDKVPNPNIEPKEYEEIRKIYTANAYLNESQRKVNALFDDAVKYSPPEKKEELKKLANEYTKILVDGKNNPKVESDAIFMLTQRLSSMESPKIFLPAEEYALDKTTQTFGNVAFDSWKRFGGSKKAPIVNIENPPAGFGLSRGEDLKNVVQGARKKFVEIATKPKREGGAGLSESEAKLEAEKMIGVTWDVGHINQLRKFGFSGEDIIKEAEKIAPLVKHIHLSDNFGMDNIELPMGMGNVDLKEVMEKLGEKGEKAKKIVEAAHWWQHMQSSPYAVTLEATGSPIYSMGMAPYWNQAIGLQQGYLGGLEGQWLPQINYETFGTSFSNLPMGLGGQHQATGRGRFSGTPME